MAAPIGNKFWTMRESHGKPRKFRKAADLWDACVKYFEWVEANPLWESKVFCYQGEVTSATVPKMRAMTLTGLCLFLGISGEAWRKYRKRKGYVAVTTRAEKIIYEQKFTGAAAELLNPNIIARDLGLSDKQETKHSGNLNVTVIDTFPEEPDKDE